MPPLVNVILAGHRGEMIYKAQTCSI